MSEQPVAQQEQGTDVPTDEFGKVYPDTIPEHVNQVLERPGHVIVVHFPASSFTTSQAAEAAVNTAVTDMCKTLGVPGPQTVAMQNRQGSVKPEGDYNGSDPDRPTALYDDEQSLAHL